MDNYMSVYMAAARYKNHGSCNEHSIIPDLIFVTAPFNMGCRSRRTARVQNGKGSPGFGCGDAPFGLRGRLKGVCSHPGVDRI